MQSISRSRAALRASVPAAAVLCAFSVLLAQRVEERDRVRNPLARDPAAIEAGREGFQARCAFCHGTDARGTGRGSNLTTGRFAHGGRDSQIFKTIRGGVPGTPMPPNEMSDTEIWQLVAFIRSVGVRGDGPPVQGDPARGEILFFAKAGCSVCHMIRGRGSPLAPDLSKIGTDRSAAAIRRALVEPDAEMAPGYALIRLELRAGGKLEGTLRNEDNFSLQLIDREGRIRSIDKQRVASLVRIENKSIMPSTAGKLAADELQDVLAFLDRQRPPLDPAFDTDESR